MLGLRRSKQSNGSMLCSQDRVDQHHSIKQGEIMDVMKMEIQDGFLIYHR